MFKTNPFKNIFGLDISDTVIRLVQCQKRGKNIVITSLNEIFIPQGIIFDGDIKDETKLKNTITNLIKDTKGKKINTRFVNCVVPERKTFIKVIQIPRAKTKELAEAIRWEASQHIPMNLEEMYLDWQTLPQIKNKQGNFNILIAAAPKNIIDSYTNLLETINLTPISFETESIATVRSIIPLNKDIVSPSLIVDLGGDHTNLVIYDKKSIQFSSSVAFSGNSLTNLIANKLKMSFIDAEKAKIIYGLEPKKGKGVVKKNLEPQFETLLEKIKEVENFYKNHFPESQNFKKIILTGGGAHLKYLDNFFNKRLKIPIEKADSLININTEKSKIYPPTQRVLSFTTPIGLSLKNFISL